MRRTLLVALAMIASTATSFADPLDVTGSLVISALGAGINGSNLLDSTVFTPLTLRNGLADGDFSGVTLGSAGTGGVINTGAINTFTMSFDFGTFTATTGSIVGQASNFLNVLYVGTFTPSGSAPAGLLGKNASAASVRLNLTQNGQTVSYGGTLQAPPEAIPEPGTYAMMGLGLAGLMLYRRRRSN